MVARRDIVSLELAGEQFEGWISYSVDSDLMVPADAFNLKVDVPTNDQARALEVTAPGSEVKVFVERVQRDGTRRRSLQMTGYIDTRQMEVTRDGGLQLTVSGRDRASLLTDASVPPGIICDSHSDRLIDLLQSACDRFGIQVIADDSAERSIMTGERRARPQTRQERREARAQGVPPSRYSRRRLEQARADRVPLDEALGVTADSGARFASGQSPSDVERLTVREARPNSGETIWDYFSRHARRFGLMLWLTPDGKLVVGAPDWDQEPLYRLIRRVRPVPGDPNTIIAGGLKEGLQNVYSEVVVYGRGTRADGTRGRIRELVLNPDYPTDAPPRPRYLNDPRIRDSDAAIRRGLAELSSGRAEAFKLTYEVDGHGQGDVLYAQSTVAFVDDERLGVRGNFYVMGRTFTADRGRGTGTSLRLVRLRSFEL